MKKQKLPELSEAELQKETLKSLSKLGIYHWRNNTGRKHNLMFGVKGGGDILGLLKNGKFLSIEVKNRLGKQSPAQIKFMDIINKNNGLAVCIHTLEELEVILIKINTNK